jgi:hypothetical protein
MLYLYATIVTQIISHYGKLLVPIIQYISTSYRVRNVKRRDYSSNFKTSTAALNLQDLRSLITAAQFPTSDYIPHNLLNRSANIPNLQPPLPSLDLHPIHPTPNVRLSPPNPQHSLPTHLPRPHLPRYPLLLLLPPPLFRLLAASRPPNRSRADRADIADVPAGGKEGDCVGFAAEWGQCAGDDGKIVRGRGIGGGEFGFYSLGEDVRRRGAPSVDESARGFKRGKGGCCMLTWSRSLHRRSNQFYRP